VTRISLPLMGKALRDLRPRWCPVEAEIQPDGRGRYPIDLSRIGRQFRPGIDGVVMVPGPDGRAYYNPVSACLYALANHTQADRTAGQPDGHLAAFQGQASHLRLIQDASGGWRYPVPVTRYGRAPGWYSAMAQGLAVSVLLRAHDITGEQSYLDSANAASTLMLRPLGSGGCTEYDESGQPFLEECPTDSPCHILNGAVYALVGLSELEARTGGRVHLSAANRLAAQLAGYDLGYWSRYDLRFSAPATLAYHTLHVSLLEAISALFANRTFGDTARRWRSYVRHPGYRLRAATAKALFVLGENRE
jgi:heparosan-N-sulfate-glucuronate 5-epimerase